MPVWAAAVMTIFAPGSAWAIAIGTYDLEVLSTSTLGGVGTSLGTITVTNATLKIQLNSGLAFTGSGNTPGFGFNLDKEASSVISGPTGAAFNPPPNSGNPATVSPFGTFSYVVSCFSCNTGTTSLLITEIAAGFSSSNFVANSDGLYFIAQVTNATGATGYIGTRASPVPGPVVGAGFPGLLMALGGWRVWRRRNQAAA